MVPRQIDPGRSQRCTSNADARPELTRREQQIVGGILGGLSNRDIALRLGIGEQSVKNRLTAIFRKLRVATRLELVVRTIERNGGGHA
jgi:DNA-binding NarL/FixJ family response regulator